MPNGRSLCNRNIIARSYNIMVIEIRTKRRYNIVLMTGNSMMIRFQPHKEIWTTSMSFPTLK